MREHEADTFVEQLVNTWPSGPKAGAWYPLLTNLDAALVRRVLDTAVATEHRMTVARFTELCRDHAGPRAAVPKCARCDTTGWVETEPITDKGHTWTQMEPCNCPAGKLAEVARNRIVA